MNSSKSRVSSSVYWMKVSRAKQHRTELSALVQTELAPALVTQAVECLPAQETFGFCKESLRQESQFRALAQQKLLRFIQA